MTFNVPINKIFLSKQETKTGKFGYKSCKFPLSKVTAK